MQGAEHGSITAVKSLALAKKSKWNDVASLRSGVKGVCDLQGRPHVFNNSRVAVRRVANQAEQPPSIPMSLTLMSRLRSVLLVCVCVVL